MRLNDPKNELGQHLIAESQLTPIYKSLTKNLTGDNIVLTDEDIPNITEWQVHDVLLRIDGQNIQMMPDVIPHINSIEVRFTRPENPRKIRADYVRFTMFHAKTAKFLTLEMQIDKAIATNNESKLNSLVSQYIEEKPVTEIQEMGKKLAGTGIENYKYAGCTTPDQILTLSQQDNLGAFEDTPFLVRTGTGSSTVNTYAETEFKHNLMSIKRGYFGTKVADGTGMFYNSNITSFGADMPCLTSGNYMFYGSKKLTSFSSDLRSLTNGQWMFNGCSKLTSFTSNLRSLIYGRYMFYNCSLTYFTSELPSLTEGYAMFYYCPLTSFTSELLKLTNGQGMFRECSKLTTFTSKLPSLTNGFQMFYKCTNLLSFTADLPKLTNGDSMFYYCTSLKNIEIKNVGNKTAACDAIRTMPCGDSTKTLKFTGGDYTKNRQISDYALAKGWKVFVDGEEVCSFSSSPEDFYNNLTNGAYLFDNGTMKEFNYDMNELLCGNTMFQGNTNLEEVNSKFPKMTYGYTMFSGCSKLKKFTGDLSSLQSCIYMFNKCTSLQTFEVDSLPSLTYAPVMFKDASLSSFSCNIPKLSRAYQMFTGCKYLTSFQSAIPRLSNGYQMFYGCKLDYPSLINIASTIRNVSGLTNGASNTEEVWKTIHIGLGHPITDEDTEQINKIKEKGWTVVVAYNK